MRFLGMDFKFQAEIVEVYENGEENKYFTQTCDSIEEAFEIFENNRDKIKNMNDFYDITCDDVRFIDAEIQCSDLTKWDTYSVLLYFVDWMLDRVRAGEFGPVDVSGDDYSKFAVATWLLAEDEERGYQGDKTRFSEYFNTYKEGYIID